MSRLRRRLPQLVLLALVVLPGVAAAQLSVGVYPLQGRLTPKHRRDATDLIEAGLRAAEPRGLVVRGPVPLPATCAPKATTACLTGLADGGAVIYAWGSEKAGQVGVMMYMVTARGLKTRAVRFTFDPEFQDLRLAYSAIELLERALAEAAPEPVAQQTLPQAAPPPEAPAPALAEAPAEVLAAEPRATETGDASALGDASKPAGAWLSPPEGEPQQEASAAGTSNWMRPTGIAATIGGALVAGGGCYFGLQSRSVSSDLTRRYSEGLLVPADRTKYRQVRSYNKLGNALMVGGGVAALTGLTLWGLSSVSFGPDGEGGGNVNVGGSW